MKANKECVIIDKVRTYFPFENAIALLSGVNKDMYFDGGLRGFRNLSTYEEEVRIPSIGEIEDFRAKFSPKPDKVTVTSSTTKTTTSTVTTVKAVVEAKKESKPPKKFNKSIKSLVKKLKKSGFPLTKEQLLIVRTACRSLDAR